MFFWVLLTYGCKEGSSNEPQNEKFLNLISPNGGEVFYLADSTAGIIWESSNIEMIRILYSKESMESWIIIQDSIKADLREFTIEIPRILADSVKLRIEDCENNYIYDESDYFFSIVKESIDPKVLNFFPINIGDVKIFKRIELDDFQDFEDSEFLVKQRVIEEKLIENHFYFNVKQEIFNINTSEKSIGKIFYRIDTTTKIVYRYSLHPEGVFVHLGLFPNEIFDIGSEHYTTLKEQNTINIFDDSFKRKAFFRGDIYGYSGHWIELLDGIGVFAYSYSADYGYSIRDTLKSAVIKGIVYGDTTWTY